MTPPSKRTFPLGAWYASHDPSLSALRRAGRAALVMPLVLFIGSKLIGNSAIATFGAFGTFSMTLLAVIEGDRRQRVEGQLVLGLAGAVFICFGTLVSRSPLLGSLSMLVIGFGVLFSSVLSSTLTNVAPALLLSFILPVSLAAPSSAIPERLAGWALASLGVVLAAAWLWPAPRSEPLRARALAACEALAAACAGTALRGEEVNATPSTPAELDALDQALGASVTALRRQFTSTPYRPTSLSIESRVLLHLVDQLTWVNSVFGFWVDADHEGRRAPSLVAMRQAIVDVLEASALLLAEPQGDKSALRSAIEHLERQPLAYEHEFTVLRSEANRSRALEPTSSGTDPAPADLLATIDASFRLQELAHGVSQIGGSALMIAAAGCRSWRDRLLGRRPEGVKSTTSIARTRASSHATWHSVWLQNSTRGAVTLALATLVASEIGLQHAFWVVLGAMAVLRSNALATGQNALRAVLGTSVGFLVGGAIVLGLGTHDAALWALLPVAILFAGVAPAAVSFTAGQAGFTVLVIVMYNLISPVGWRVGATRIQDVGIGCAVSLVGGLLFWPRGASASLRRALSDAYQSTASYLSATIHLAARQSEPEEMRSSGSPDLGSATAALQSSIRLDDAFRTYLNERGAKSLPLAEVTSLVTGVTRLRLAGDAIVVLWHEAAPLSSADPAAVCHELVGTASLQETWFDAFARSLSTATARPGPPVQGGDALERLVPLIRPELRSDDYERWWSAIRVAWTADFLDAVAKMQVQLAEPMARRQGDDLPAHASP